MICVLAGGWFGTKLDESGVWGNGFNADQLGRRCFPPDGFPFVKEVFVGENLCEVVVDFLCGECCVGAMGGVVDDVANMFKVASEGEVVAREPSE